VSNRNKKKKRPAASSYRAPASSAAPPQRKGLLDTLLAPRTPGASPMPKLRSTLARGATTTATMRWVVGSVPILVMAVWLLLLLAGFEGPFKLMAFVYSIPPVSALADASVLPLAFRPAMDATGPAAALPSILGIFGGIVFHGVLTALVATTAVEQLRTGAVSTWSLRRTPRVARVTSVVGVIALGMFMVGQIVAQVLGQIGLFVFVGAIVAGLYFLGFAPAIAADEDRGLISTLTRSARAARMPGSANLWVAIGYFVVCAVCLFAPLPGSTIGVTPSIAAWVVALVVNVIHILVQVTLAYRYLVVAPEVPEQPAPRTAPAGRR
jgi:hypothetical protein